MFFLCVCVLMIHIKSKNILCCKENEFRSDLSLCCCLLYELIICTLFLTVVRDGSYSGNICKVIL